MKSVFDRFLLNFPRLYIKQYPYAWIAFIALWAWPPTISIIFLIIILIGMTLLHFQHKAWVNKIHEEFAGADGKFHVDRPAIPWVRAVRTIAILFAVSALGAFFLKDRIRFDFWEIFLIVAGFPLLYRDAYFFGAPVTYIVTASGIGIYFAPGHLDYRLLLRYNEISHVDQSTYKKDMGWTFFARTPDVNKGLLISPKDPNGFSKRVKKMFIVPRDTMKFIEQLPHGFRPL